MAEEAEPRQRNHRRRRYRAPHWQKKPKPPYPLDHEASEPDGDGATRIQTMKPTIMGCLLVGASATGDAVVRAAAGAALLGMGSGTF